MKDGKQDPPGSSGRGWGVFAEDVLIWAAILALWPWILRGRWIFTGAWVTVLLWVALAAMLVVFARRLRRMLKGPAGGGGAAAGRAAKGSHADQ